MCIKSLMKTIQKIMLVNINQVFNISTVAIFINPMSNTDLIHHEILCDNSISFKFAITILYIY